MAPEGRATEEWQKYLLVGDLFCSWLSAPELRLGQLIYDALHANSPDERDDLARRLFYIEDTPLIEALESFTANYAASVERNDASD